jgi:hypothetical protein
LEQKDKKGENMSAEIMQGIASGIDQGVRNFINIKNALSQEKERKTQSDVDFKIKKLQLQKVENELSPERLLMEQEKLKVENAAAKTSNALNMIKIKAAKEEIKNDLLSRAQFLKMMQEKSTMAPGSAFSFGGLKVAGPKQGASNDVIDDNLIYGGNKDTQKEDFWSAFK